MKERKQRGGIGFTLVRTAGDTPGSSCGHLHLDFDTAWWCASDGEVHYASMTDGRLNVGEPCGYRGASRCAYCNGSGEAYDPTTGEGPRCPACAASRGA